MVKEDIEKAYVIEDPLPEFTDDNEKRTEMLSQVNDYLAYQQEMMRRDGLACLYACKAKYSVWTGVTDELIELYLSCGL